MTDGIGDAVVCARSGCPVHRRARELVQTGTGPHTPRPTVPHADSSTFVLGARSDGDGKVERSPSSKDPQAPWGRSQRRVVRHRGHGVIPDHFDQRARTAHQRPAGARSALVLTGGWPSHPTKLQRVRGRQHATRQHQLAEPPICLFMYSSASTSSPSAGLCCRFSLPAGKAAAQGCTPVPALRARPLRPVLYISK